MIETLYSHLLRTSYLVALPQRNKSTHILFEMLLGTVDILLGSEKQTQIKQRYSISFNIPESFLLVYNAHKKFCIFKYFFFLLCCFLIVFWGWKEELTIHTSIVALMAFHILVLLKSSYTARYLEQEVMINFNSAPHKETASLGNSWALL